MARDLLSDHRVRLRPLAATDLEPLGLGRSPGLVAPCPALGPAGTDGRLESLLRPTDAGRAFAVTALGTDGATGLVALLGLDWKNRHATLAWIEAGFDRGAAAGAALSLLARFAFDELGLERLEAETLEPEGTVVMSALGFQREALKRDAALAGARRRDLTLWGLLRDERPTLERPVGTMRP